MSIRGCTRDLLSTLAVETCIASLGSFWLPCIIVSYRHLGSTGVGHLVAEPFQKWSDRTIHHSGTAAALRVGRSPWCIRRCDQGGTGLLGPNESTTLSCPCLPYGVRNPTLYRLLEGSELQLISDASRFGSTYCIHAQQTRQGSTPAPGAPKSEPSISGIICPCIGCF